MDVLSKYKNQKYLSYSNTVKILKKCLNDSIDDDYMDSLMHFHFIRPLIHGEFFFNKLFNPNHIDSKSEDINFYKKENLAFELNFYTEGFFYLTNDEDVFLENEYNLCSEFEVHSIIFQRTDSIRIVKQRYTDNYESFEPFKVKSDDIDSFENSLDYEHVLKKGNIVGLDFESSYNYESTNGVLTHRSQLYFAYEDILAYLSKFIDINEQFVTDEDSGSSKLPPKTENSLACLLAVMATLPKIPKSDFEQPYGELNLKIIKQADLLGMSLGKDFVGTWIKKIHSRF